MSSPGAGWLLLLRFLPREFREAHRRELIEQIREYSAGEMRTRARWRALGRIAVDVAWVGVRLRTAAVWAAVSGGLGRDGVAVSIGRAVAAGLRSLRRDWMVTAFGVTTVALGIAASSTVFGVVQALLLRPLPFTDPDELVWISNGDWGRGQALSELSVQVAHVQDVRAESRTIERVAGFNQFDRPGDHTLSGAAGAQRLNRLRVTDGFFEMLGIGPLHGRLFSEDELREGGPAAVLLMHGLWMHAFGGDASIAGRTILIDGSPVLVAGVLPESFDFAGVFAPGTRIDYVAPFALGPANNRRGNTLALIGRLAPGATVRTAEAELRGIASRPHSDRRNDFRPTVSPLSEHLTGSYRTALLVLSAAVGLVMLLVCANLSSLLLARGLSRRREMAIRGALGAGRGRLVLHALTESLLLSLAGCALGVVLAAFATQVVGRLDGSVPLLMQVRLDHAGLLFAVVVSMLAGLTFGIVPALRASASPPHEALRDSARGSTAGGSAGRARRALVVAEVALACLLVTGAGLLVRSFMHVLEADLGFEPANTLAVRIDPSVRFGSAAAEQAYYDDVMARVRALPIVEAAGLTDVLPTTFNRRWCAGLPGVPRSEDEPCPTPFVRVVSEGFVRAMGLAMVAGRDFEESDDASASDIAVVNESLAGLLWPGQDPLGRVMRVSGAGERIVVGVVRGTRFLSPEQEPGPELFLPIRQVTDYSATHLVVRGTRSPGAIAEAVRRAIRSVDASAPVDDVVRIEDMLDRALSPRRFLVQLLAGFGAFALVIACIGLYGVISFSVRQRERELAIRLALGASSAGLRMRVLGETVRLALIGILIGVPFAWAAGRALSGLLYEVTPGDPLSFALAPVALIGVAMLAGYLPSRRAARLDPATALAGGRPR